MYFYFATGKYFGFSIVSFLSKEKIFHDFKMLFLKEIFYHFLTSIIVMLII